MTSNFTRRGLIALSAAAVLFSGLTTWAQDNEPRQKAPRGVQVEVKPEMLEGAYDRGAVPRSTANVTTPRVNPEDVKGPRAIIESEEPVFDFGKVWVGPTLNHQFKVTNKGDAPLDITRVKPACGCTLAGTYPRRLEPGESGYFPFAMQSEKLRGRFDKSITLSTNDPVTPEYRLRLRGEVQRYVDVVPASASFGRLVGAELQERVVHITNNTESPLKLSLDKAADGKFKYEIVEEEPGQKFQLKVIAAPPFPTGDMNSTVTLKTNIPEQDTVEVAVRGVVPERIDVQPSTITLPAPRQGAMGAPAGLSRIIRVTNYGDSPVKLEEAFADDPAVTVTVSERTEGRAYTVVLQFPPNYETPPAGINVTVKTDDAEKPLIKVPVRSPSARLAQNQPPPQPERRSADQLVGKPAPGFNLTTTDGKSLTNADLTGKVTILDFFAVNCGFCTRQIPRVEAVRKEFADNKDVRFVAVSQTMRREYSAEETISKVKELGFEGEIALDPQNTSGPVFNATGFPTMIVIGKTGNVESAIVGNAGDLESRLKSQITALLAGKPIPAEAPVAQAQQPEQRRSAGDMLGQQAPAFEFETTDGKKVNNVALVGSPAVVLNFFAPNCGFCKQQIPRLEPLRTKFADKGVRFINVSQTMRQPFTPEQVTKMMSDLGFNGELAIDHENKVGPLFGATGYPTMMVLGKSGKVEAVNIGNMGDLESRLEGQLTALIEGKPVPQVAQQPQQPRKRPAEEMVGKPAPSFSTRTMDGKELSSAGFAKHPATVLNFVAPNCGFCKRQVPTLEKIRVEYEPKGVRIVNVSETMRQEFTEEQTKDIFVTQLNTQIELVKDTPNEIGKLFKATSYPTMVVVDRSGQISHVNIGARQDLEQVLRGQLDALINKPQG